MEKHGHNGVVSVTKELNDPEEKKAYVCRDDEFDLSVLFDGLDVPAFRKHVEWRIEGGGEYWSKASGDFSTPQSVKFLADDNDPNTPPEAIPDEFIFTVWYDRDDDGQPGVNEDSMAIVVSGVRIDELVLADLVCNDSRVDKSPNPPVNGEAFEIFPNSDHKAIISIDLSWLPGAAPANEVGSCFVWKIMEGDSVSAKWTNVEGDFSGGAITSEYDRVDESFEGRLLAAMLFT
jgi:hypothetical protein